MQGASQRKFDHHALLAVILAVTFTLASTVPGLAQAAVSCVDDNGDGLTDVTDIQAVARHWRGAFDRLYDLDGDGDQDVVDVQLVAAHWNQPCLTVALSAPASVTSGTPFGVDVSVAHSTGLGGFEFVLNFNPALAQAQSATVGPFLGSTGRTVVPLDPVIDNGQGTLHYVVISYGDQPTPTGDGLLATVTLTPTVPGTLSLWLDSVILSDGAGQPLPFTLRDDTVQITAR